MIIRYLFEKTDQGITFPLPLFSRFIVMWMLTLLVCMTKNLRTYLQVPALIQDISCSSALAFSFGKVNFKQRLPSAHSMENMLPSSHPSENSSTSNKFSESLSPANTFPTPLLPSILKFLKITTFLLQTTVSVSTPTTLMLSGISLGHMWMKDMWKSPIVAQRNNKQTISQKVFEKFANNRKSNQGW